jgi:ATP-dependent Zn protease
VNGVIIMAGTNCPGILDPALLSPGGFDRKLTAGAPARVSGTLTERRATLYALARMLLERVVVERAALDELLKAHPRQA